MRLVNEEVLDGVLDDGETEGARRATGVCAPGMGAELEVKTR